MQTQLWVIDGEIGVILKRAWEWMVALSPKATVQKVVMETCTLKRMCAHTRVYAVCVYMDSHSYRHRLRSIQQRLFGCITDLLATTWSSCSGWKQWLNNTQVELCCWPRITGKYLPLCRFAKPVNLQKSLITVHLCPHLDCCSVGICHLKLCNLIKWILWFFSNVKKQHFLVHTQCYEAK